MLRERKEKLIVKKLANLPFGPERTTLILSQANKYLPATVDEIKQHLNGQGDIMGEVKALFWIAKAKERSPVETATLLAQLHIALVVQAYAMDLAGSVLLKLEEKRACDKTAEEVIAELADLSSSQTLARLVEFHKHFPKYNDNLEDLWGLLSGYVS